MCGLAGVARPTPSGVSDRMLLRMAAAIRHRGPDGYGLYAGRRVGLAHTRLSIIDLTRGAQPLTNEDGSVLVVYNGEIYNYVELRADLMARGHTFTTTSDTEVLVHGWEEWGEGMLGRLNGQFAFAIYDRRTEIIVLARDRFGIHPLFYAVRNGTLYFGSEVKALLASGEVEVDADPAGLHEVFTLWGARAPRTPFRGIQSLEPGCVAVWRAGVLTTRRYYHFRFPEARDDPPDALDQLDAIMRSSVQLRMRADVPVGGYLSGGLDSSITCALAASGTTHDLRTFSVTFEDPALDESRFQRVVARRVGSRHVVRHINRRDIAQVFPQVIAHTETPVVRTAPAPLFLLSELTRANGIKVVLTGEGSDEVFLGYDLFKETAVRLFCLRNPQSASRARLFDRLYPYLSHGGGEFWRNFFLQAGSPVDPLFSHLPRFSLAGRIGDFYSADFRAALRGVDPLGELRSSLPEEFERWSPLNRAAYLELVTLLGSYLLSSQGERMAMAHGVETRVPFLDHRLFEFAAALPTRSKMCGLREKVLLRRWARRVIPRDVADRPKQPYRAPDAPAFFGTDQPDYVEEVLSPASLGAVGVFDARAVAGLLRRCRSGAATGFRENQALVAILSTQLWHRRFFGAPAQPADLPLDRADVLLHDPAAAAAEPLLSGARV